ncbi:hypothetical protein NDU88_002262 [Pleurodeles waltl]|uniref:Uncharacterized protein n=1 Tax=Pleurodeles waltl TaxID=8319 RepID=A0AAV7M2W6_PLEWA|nr:hypothetical protein NDU88_002262 [Pleurodeles waltl]
MNCTADPGGTEPLTGHATVGFGALEPIPPPICLATRSGTNYSFERGPLGPLVPHTAATRLCNGPEMPGGRSSHKNSGKPPRQLLFSEALLQMKGPSPTPATQPPATHHDMTDSAQYSTMDRTLQEISAVSRRLEGMDSAMVSLTAETKSIRMEIASFQTHVLGLEQQVSTEEAHASSFQDRDQEFLFLRSKLTDLEYRSRRDNVAS